jgi:small subunit ribosomal protein S2
VAVVDTNCSPDGISAVIPGNDDALRAIRLFASRIADAIIEGKNIGTEGGVAPEIEEDEAEEMAAPSMPKSAEAFIPEDERDEPEDLAAEVTGETPVEEPEEETAPAPVEEPPANTEDEKAPVEEPVEAPASESVAGAAAETATEESEVKAEEAAS